MRLFARHLTTRTIRMAAPRRGRAAAAEKKTEAVTGTETGTAKTAKTAKKDEAEAAAKKAEAAVRAPSRKRKGSVSEGPAPVGPAPGEPASEPASEEPASAKTAARTAKKAKKGGDAADAPLAARTDVATLPKAMYIGAHVSSAGGVHNAVANAEQVGGNAFALFLKSQRTWKNAPLAAEARDGFRAACAARGYDAGQHCLPHGSYLVNLAQADPAKAAQAYASFVDDLRRCAALGIRLYNFHPGAATSGSGSGSGSRDEALARIADALNRAHRDTAPADVVTVLENMAGGGSAVGARFEDLAAIVARVDDKRRVGVCLDTCHAFAAGYDLRTPDALAAVLAEFDRVVGLRYLRALHLNDSKAPLGSRRDLHANIGTGFLGLRAFHALVNTDALAGLPMVLETPIDRPAGPGGKTVEDRQVWADEIKLLERLIGMDPDTEAFRAKAAALQAQGAAERQRVQAQVDKRR